jgi:hypothetical protein
MTNPAIKLMKSSKPTARQSLVRIGDLFEMVGRQRTIWSVIRLVKIPGSNLLAEMSQIDGLGRVSVKVDDLITEILFKKINSAVV